MNSNGFNSDQSTPTWLCLKQLFFPLKASYFFSLNSFPHTGKPESQMALLKNAASRFIRCCPNLNYLQFQSPVSLHLLRQQHNYSNSAELHWAVLHQLAQCNGTATSTTLIGTALFKTTSPTVLKNYLFLHGSGFPCSIMSQKGGNLSFIEVQCETIYSNLLAITINLDQVLDGNTKAQMCRLFLLAD